MTTQIAWPVVKLGTLATFKNGLNFAGTSWGKGLKIIGVSDFKDRIFPNFASLDQINPQGVVRPKDLLQAGDIVFVRSNGNRELIGRCLYLRDLEEPVSHSGFTIRLRFEAKSVCTPFYVYLFRSHLIRRALSDFGGGTNINNLNQDILSKLVVPLPCLATQQKIAAILYAYDDLIANNQRRITLLERMAEDIYREWFVRLRFPGHEFAVREKGIPQGWRIRNLGDVMELCYGKALKDEVRVPGIFPVYGSAGVVGTHNAGLVDGPGIVVGRKGNVGSVFWSDHAFFPIDTAYFVRSDTSLHYLFFLLQSMNFINNDSAVPGLNRQQAYSNKLLFPPDELIKQFSVKAKSIFKLKQVLLAEVELLKATRDALLPRLISGKLAVDGLDIRFPPAMSAAD